MEAEQNLIQNNLNSYLAQGNHPQPNNITLRAVKKEMQFNLDTNVLQTTIINSINEILKQNQSNTDQVAGKILTMVGQEIDKLSGNIISAFNEVRDRIDKLELKCASVYEENDQYKQNNSKNIDTIFSQNQIINNNQTNINEKLQNQENELTNFNKDLKNIKNDIKIIQKETKSKASLFASQEQLTKTNEANEKLFKEVIESKKLINNESKQREKFERKIEDSINKINKDNKIINLPPKFNDEKINQLIERLNNLEKEIKKNNKNLNNEEKEKNEPIKDIEIKEFEKTTKEKDKKYKIVQKNNKIIFAEISKDCNDEEDKEKDIADKVKIVLKKGILENAIVYEVSTLCKDWNFSRHMKNIIKRINMSKSIFKVNLRKLETVYIMKWNDKQIQFIPQKAISDFIYSKNYYVKFGNNMIYVKNNRNKKFYNQKKIFYRTFKKNNFNFKKNFKNNNIKKFNKTNYTNNYQKNNKTNKNTIKLLNSILKNINENNYPKRKQSNNKNKNINKNNNKILKFYKDNRKRNKKLNKQNNNTKKIFYNKQNF